MAKDRTCSRDGCPNPANPDSRLRLCWPHQTGAAGSQPRAHVVAAADVPACPDCGGRAWLNSRCLNCPTGLLPNSVTGQSGDLARQAGAKLLALVPQLPDPTTPHAYVRRDAHQSEKQAAAAVLPRSGTQRAAVLAAIAAGANGATDWEVSQTIGLMPPRVATRRLELVEQGWISDSGLRRPTPSGVEAIVWKLTDAARQQL